MADKRLRRRRTAHEVRPAAFDGEVFQRLRNPYAPLDVLRPAQVAAVDDAAMRILEELGLDFWHDGALDLLARAGARVDHSGRHAWLDRGLVREAIAQAPREIYLRARNPLHDLVIGGDHIVFSTSAGTPFYSDMTTGRRPCTLEDYKRVTQLAQLAPAIHKIEGMLMEPVDVPTEKRYIERGYWQLLLSDKVYHIASHGRANVTDYINMASLVFGGLESIMASPVLGAVVNANSPLRFDDRMLDGLMTLAEYGQMVVVTPFTLAGAMAPITIEAALAQSTAEALAGIVLTQLVRPGSPVVMGGFTTNVDMHTGSPAMGTPENALGLAGVAQMARFYGLPSRGSGGLTNAKLPDAQAAREAQWALWPAVMSHTNMIIHAAGWLDGGLVTSLEKFIIDLEGLSMMHRFLRGFEVNDDTLGFEAMAEVGPGGHHFGTAHTLSRYRNAFQDPLIADRQTYDAWLGQGGRDTYVRANELAQRVLADYRMPPMDPGVREALDDYRIRRLVEIESGMDGVPALVGG